jgi:TrmH family RNA methyltransferase
VLLLGNEGAGVAPDLLELASLQVVIPHSPRVESLNVAAAAAPLLLERWRQNQAGSPGESQANRPRGQDDRGELPPLRRTHQ